MRISASRCDLGWLQVVLKPPTLGPHTVWSRYHARKLQVALRKLLCAIAVCKLLCAQPTGFQKAGSFPIGKLVFLAISIKLRGRLPGMETSAHRLRRLYWFRLGTEGHVQNSILGGRSQTRVRIEALASSILPNMFKTSLMILMCLSNGPCTFGELVQPTRNAQDESDQAMYNVDSVDAGDASRPC